MIHLSIPLQLKHPGELTIYRGPRCNKSGEEVWVNEVSIVSALTANPGDPIGLRILVANREDEGFVVAKRLPVNDFTADYGTISGALMARCRSVG